MGRRFRRYGAGPPQRKVELEPTYNCQTYNTGVTTNGFTVKGEQPPDREVGAGLDAPLIRHEARVMRLVPAISGRTDPASGTTRAMMGAAHSCHRTQVKRTRRVGPRKAPKLRRGLCGGGGCS